MKKYSDKTHALSMAVAWTLAAVFAIVATLYRDRSPLQIAVAVLFVIDAVLWWLRWYRLKGDYKKQEENNHE